mgnify:CR=1 FL=1
MSIVQYKNVECLIPDTDMNPAVTIVMAALTVASGSSPDYVSDALWEMSHDIAIQHYMNFRCICLIVEYSTDAVDRMFPIEIPVYQIQLPLQVVRNSVRLTPG